MFDENIDETVEVFNTASWMKMTVSGNAGDSLIDKALHYISEASEALAALMNQSRITLVIRNCLS